MSLLLSSRLRPAFSNLGLKSLYFDVDGGKNADFDASFSRVWPSGK